jgi:hypothetical protein
MALNDRSARGITVDIGELVLHGFPAAQRHHIGDAVLVELERLFAERGLPMESEIHSSRDHVDGGAFRVAARGASPAVIGQHIATAVYASLTATPAAEKR